MALITYLTRVHFAEHVLEDALPEEAARAGLKRPLLIRDEAGLSADLTDRLILALPPDCETVDFPLPPVDPATVAAAARACRAERCDGVIALGGAVALDTARRLGAFLQASGEIVVIAVPTTIGNIGLGPLAPLGDGPRGMRGLGRAGPLPSVILCDPTLAVAPEPTRIATEGFDTLTHCIEAYLSTSFNPPADGIALEGVRRAQRHLEALVADPTDIEARSEMLSAALCAGLASEKGLGGAEALARALEAEMGPGTRHGEYHAALLPLVMTFNAPAVIDRFEHLREALLLPPGADLRGALAELGARLRLPVRIGGAGLGEDALRRTADFAVAERASSTNPRHATVQDYLGLLQSAL